MTSTASADSAAVPRAGVQEASEPVILGSYNVGLLSNHVWDEANSTAPTYFYEFTKGLQQDIIEAFSSSFSLQILMICEVGSMLAAKPINEAFFKRASAFRNGSVQPLAKYSAFKTFDVQSSFSGYLCELLKSIKRSDLKIWCAPPYAVIWDPESIDVIGQPVRVQPLPEDPARYALLFILFHIPSKVQFRAVLNHSPSSKNWKWLSHEKKHRIVRALAEAGGASANNNTATYWVLMGDLNTEKAVLQAATSKYWHPSLQPYNDPLALRVSISCARSLGSWRSWRYNCSVCLALLAINPYMLLERRWGFPASPHLLRSHNLLEYRFLAG